MSKPKARFDQINIVSGDPIASTAFYRRLGVDIRTTPSGARRAVLIT